MQVTLDNKKIASCVGGCAGRRHRRRVLLPSFLLPTAAVAAVAVVSFPPPASFFPLYFLDFSLNKGSEAEIGSSIIFLKDRHVRIQIQNPLPEL